MKYLIIDDREENIRAAKIHFGNRASYSLNTLEGIEKLTIEKPDLVISDLQMEHERSGLDIAYAAGLRGIFTHIATGGVGHGKEYVAVIPKNSWQSKRNEIDGSKNDPQVWKKIEEIVGEGHTFFEVIGEGWNACGKFPWEVLEWAYVGDLGFYQPSEKMKKIVYDQLNSIGGKKNEHKTR